METLPSTSRDGSSSSSLGVPATDLESMNMEEFLRNIWTAEESQAMASALHPLSDAAGSHACLATQISLQTQVSLSRPLLSSTLSMKVEEEAWKSLQPPQASVGGADGPQRHQLEITLEDFLVNSGIMREGPPSYPSPPSLKRNGGFSAQGNDARFNRSGNENMQISPKRLSLQSPPSGSPSSDITQQDGPQGMLNSPVHTPAQQGDWMSNPSNKDLSQQQQHATEQILQGSAMEQADPSYSNTPLISPGHDESSADTSNLLNAQFGILGPPVRMRCSEGPLEKVIQRRQRRMIKNRESAARSRARKQAYTVELEWEVRQLKEENIKLLRKQEEESELRKKQILAVMPSSVLREGCALKRTYTG